MASEAEIISAIESIVLHYPSWTIGITEDPERRKRQHGNPARWHQWYAVLETSARNIEKYFLAKGMKGEVGGGLSPTWVYIFT